MGVVLCAVLCVAVRDVLCACVVCVFVCCVGVCDLPCVVLGDTCHDSDVPSCWMGLVASCVSARARVCMVWHRRESGASKVVCVCGVFARTARM